MNTMWPWEHLAFGYVLYSLYTHLRHGESPRGLPVLALAFATQFPDLVDKPLAWTLHVLPGGRTLAHTLFVALPLSAGAILVARRERLPAVGTAFAVGYLSHLLGDVVYPLALGLPVGVGFLFWPVVPAPTGGVEHGVVELLRRYATQYLADMAPGRLFVYVGLELGLLLGAFGLWIRDGLPGVDSLRRLVGRGLELVG